MATAFESFAALHVPGKPLILCNVWDAGSAQVVAQAGAQAIATGSWSVAAAQGFPDGEALPLERSLQVARDIVAAVDLPVTIDFESGYAIDLDRLGENFAALAATGAVGCNFEDGFVDGSGVHDIAEAARRIAAARAAVGDGFFLNARTDLFLQAERSSHGEALADAAIARAEAFAAAGASGLFVPGLGDLHLIARICVASPIPVNAIAFPGAPSTAEFAAAGVARVSHGPAPWRVAMQALEEVARVAHAR